MASQKSLYWLPVWLSAWFFAVLMGVSAESGVISTLEIKTSEVIGESCMALAARALRRVFDLGQEAGNQIQA